LSCLLFNASVEPRSYGAHTTRPQGGMKSPQSRSGPWFALALAGIYRRVVHTKAIEKKTIVPPSAGWWERFYLISGTCRRQIQTGRNQRIHAYTHAHTENTAPNSCSLSLPLPLSVPDPVFPGSVQILKVLSEYSVGTVQRCDCLIRFQHFAGTGPCLAPRLPQTQIHLSVVGKPRQSYISTWLIKNSPPLWDRHVSLGMVLL
jgi:hypothetical protein